jgi:DNA-binding protein HU-beta
VIRGLPEKQAKNAEKPLARRARGGYIASTFPTRADAAAKFKRRSQIEPMASGPMTKSQLINHISETVDVPRKTAQAMLQALSDVAYKEAKKGFTLPGLGKLVLVARKARVGRNPMTGASIKIPAKKVLKFRIAKAAKDAILGAKK